MVGCESGDDGIEDHDGGGEDDADRVAIHPVRSVSIRQTRVS